MLLLEHAPGTLDDRVVVRAEDPEAAKTLPLARPEDRPADRLTTLLCDCQISRGREDRTRREHVLVVGQPDQLAGLGERVKHLCESAMRQRG